ncbi:hypothetical protein GCM10009540_36650 [Streptomyces turgidiscabies]
MAARRAERMTTPHGQAMAEQMLSYPTAAPPRGGTTRRRTALGRAQHRRRTDDGPWIQPVPQPSAATHPVRLKNSPGIKPVQAPTTNSLSITARSAGVSTAGVL